MTATVASSVDVPAEPRVLTVLGWAGYLDGPGQYRIGLPMWALGQLGHRAAAFTDLDVMPGSEVDVLVGQRVIEPARSEVWRAIARNPARGFALVFEIDDDLWNVDPANPHARAFNSDEAREVLATNVAMADAVTVTTDRLADVVAQYNPNVHVLPNCVDGGLLQNPFPVNERVTVGWAGGESHEHDFQSVRRELSSYFRKNPDIDLSFVGGPFHRLLGRPDARWSPGNPNLNEYLALFDFDIAIAPLAYTAFNRSKSDIKVLEYAVLGRPVVASDFGPYGVSVQHGVTGLLARHPHEWARHLRALAADAEMRAEYGRNARMWAETRTIQANAWRWEAVYRSL